MARLHSRKKGKSGSKRPKTIASVAAKQLEIQKDEVEGIILKMAKEGVPQAKIGLIMRDKYNVPNARSVLGVKLNKFLIKNNAVPEYPDDLLNLIKRAVHVRGHLKTSKKDVHNRVKLSHIESKIQRLVKYYARTGRIPTDWRYNPEKAALLVK